MLSIQLYGLIHWDWIIEVFSGKLRLLQNRQYKNMEITLFMVKLLRKSLDNLPSFIVIHAASIQMMFFKRNFMKKLLIVLFVAGALSARSAIKDNSEVSFASHHHQSSVYKTGKTALPIPASAQDWEKYSVAKTSKLIDVPLQEKKSLLPLRFKFKLVKRPAKGRFYREFWVGPLMET